MPSRPADRRTIMSGDMRGSRNAITITAIKKSRSDGRNNSIERSTYFYKIDFIGIMGLLDVILLGILNQVYMREQMLTTAIAFQAELFKDSAFSSIRNASTIHIDSITTLGWA
jgi:hypothetical protein